MKKCTYQTSAGRRGLLRPRRMQPWSLCTRISGFSCNCSLFFFWLGPLQGKTQVSLWGGVRASARSDSRVERAMGCLAGQDPGFWSLLSELLPCFLQGCLSSATALRAISASRPQRRDWMPSALTSSNSYDTTSPFPFHSLCSFRASTYSLHSGPPTALVWRGRGTFHGRGGSRLYLFQQSWSLNLHPIIWMSPLPAQLLYEVTVMPKESMTCCSILKQAQKSRLRRRL